MREDPRAAKLWDLLIAQAGARQHISYSEAAVRVGWIARGMGALLRPLQRYCADQRLPNLAVLVVYAGTRQQGGGFVGDPVREFARVCAHDWSGVENPFIGGIASWLTHSI